MDQPAGPVYEKTLYAGWGDMDFNAHMRNTAFLDKSADVRMMFFAEHGFPSEEFVRRKIGPVILRDDVEYFREVPLLGEVRVTLSLGALSEDGSRFRIRNEFLRADGQLAARVTSTGGWLDLAVRKLTAPPAALLAALQSLPRTADFEVVPSSLREKS
jgi:acyl-CoA thioester hydrolase